MECARQDEGDGGKLWGVMRPHKTLEAAADCGMQCAGQDHVAGGKKAVCMHLPPHQIKFAFNGVGMHGFVSVNFCCRCFYGFLKVILEGFALACKMDLMIQFHIN